MTYVWATQWIYDEERCVVAPVVAQSYEIDLEKISTRADADDWLHHMAGKAWVTPLMLSELRSLFDAWLECVLKVGQR